MSAEERTFSTQGDLEVTATVDSRRGDLFDPACPTRQLLDRLSGKWTSMVITLLSDDNPAEIRFSALRRRMPGVSQKMLAQTLKSLERDSLVSRRVKPATPPEVHYGLTDLGLSLSEPIAHLRGWAETHMGRIDDAGAAWDRARSSGGRPQGT